MFSLSTKEEIPVITPDQKDISIIKSIQPSFNSVGGMEEYARQQMVKDVYEDFFKSGSLKKTAGTVSPSNPAFDYTDPRVGYQISPRGIREKIARVNHYILRDIAYKVAPISAIQTVRTMQIEPFSVVSQNIDEVGFKARLKDREAVPDSKDKKIYREIQNFFEKTGFTNFKGAYDREDRLMHIMKKLTIEMMTIDQVAIYLRRSKKGKLLDFWALDAATIKRVDPFRGFEGNKNIKFVQDVSGKIATTFTSDELIFYCNNRKTDMINYGYGYSYVEMTLDLVTGWLFAMAHNKEVFNSSAMPKGFLSFESDKIDVTDLEDLQRQWIAMFRGVKGLWKTPFLQYGAKWQNMAPSNQDMQWDKYTQMLASWVCAIHGIDPQELGIRLNQAQNVLNENQDKKIAYSKDRGLKSLLRFNQVWMNLIMERIPEWEDYEIEFTGLEAKGQKERVDVDRAQLEAFMTINEKRKERDLEPIPEGDIVANPQYVQYLSQKQQMSGMGGGQPTEQPQQTQGEDSLSPEEENMLLDTDEKELEKSKDIFQRETDYIEISLD